MGRNVAAANWITTCGSATLGTFALLATLASLLRQRGQRKHQKDRKQTHKPFHGCLLDAKTGIQYRLIFACSRRVKPLSFGEARQPACQFGQDRIRLPS